MMENNYFFNKLTSKHRAEKDVLVIIRLQETKNSNLYNKSCAQDEHVKCHIQHEESWPR